MAVLYTPHYIQFFNDSGLPLSGGKLYAFAAGTGTAGQIDGTPKNMYTDSSATTPTANPLILDSAGRAVAFIDGSYKFGLTDSSNNIISVVDNVSSFSAGNSAISITNFSQLSTDTPVGADLFIFSDNSDSGNSKTVSFTDLSTFFGGGNVLQVVSTTTGALVTGNTSIPYDDTIPQITEGFEVITRAITPLSATSVLYIDFYGTYNIASHDEVTAALFVDSTANAIAAACIGDNGADVPGTFLLRHPVTSGSTTARTYKARVGAASTISIYINGDASGTRVYGGVAATGIRIMEVEP